MKYYFLRTSFIDDKTKNLLGLAKTATENSYKIHEDTIQKLRDQGYSDPEILKPSQLHHFSTLLTKWWTP